LAKRLLMLRMLMEEASTRFPEQFRRSAFRAAYESLSSRQADSPQAVRRVLTYPGTGAWLDHCLRRLAGPGATERMPPLWADLGYLGWLAASAGSGSERDAPLPVVVRDGEVMLPGAGLAQVAPASESGVGTFRRADRTSSEIEFNKFSIRWEPGADEAQRGWRPLPVFTFPGGDPLSVRVDDSDPFLNPNYLRAERGRPPSGRTGFAEPFLWQSLSDGAAELLSEACPSRSPVVARWLAVVQPPRFCRPGQATSSTSPASFGCVEISLPQGPSELALTLVHEFQHAVLGALLDYVSLTLPAERSQFYAPWVGAMRPAKLLLQGAYAHLAVADFWRGCRDLHGGREQRRHAAAQYARIRAEVTWSIDQVRGSGALTPAGERFADQLRAACDGLDEWPGRPYLAAR
jgi:HEXXH motif-containing protein